MARRLSRWLVLAGWCAVSSAGLGGCGAPEAEIRYRYRLGVIDPLPIGDSRALTFVGAPPASRSDVRWTSANPAVASVNAAGIVRALQAGATRITAHLPDGEASATIEVATAKLRWVQYATPRPRRFVAASPGGWVFSVGVTAASCDPYCPGELAVYRPDGTLAAEHDEAASVTVGAEAGWFQRHGQIFRVAFADPVSAVPVAEGLLLARFSDGDLLAAVGNALFRLDANGSRELLGPVVGTIRRALILDGDAVAVSHGDAQLSLLAKGGVTGFRLAAPQILWGTDRLGRWLLTDGTQHSFTLFDGAESTLLPGFYSVLIGPDGRLVTSEGLSASISVPVATQRDATLFIALHTTGSAGETKYTDVVFRAGEIPYWRWGPSACTDHPFAVATGRGFAVLSDCNRIALIDDVRLAPAGAWPQPGGDAGRSWAAGR